MDEEIWKDIEGYEGLYQVSNMGRVKSLNYRHTGKEKLLKPGKHKCGYLYVILWKERKPTRYSIHRLVLSTFSPVENMHELQVNHINEKKADNRLENLEWCDRSYNNNYDTRNDRVAERNSIPIVQLTIGGKYIKIWKSSMDAQRKGGFNQGHIIQCCKGKRKTHKGYKWQYLHTVYKKI